MSNGFQARAMFPSLHNMTLEIVLWSIPAGSLAAAMALIAVRAWRLTRDGAIGEAILAGANGPARELETDGEQFPIEVATARSGQMARPALQNPRLCPVPIVVCVRRRPAA